jgi:hypothetical protein
MSWVPGSFSVSPGKSLQVGFAHIQLNVRTELNMTHTINKFAFGDGFPGFVSPLDGRAAPLPVFAPQRHSLCPWILPAERLKDAQAKFSVVRTGLDYDLKIGGLFS